MLYRSSKRPRHSAPALSGSAEKIHRYSHFPFSSNVFFLKSIPIKSSHLMANRTFRHVGCLVEARGLEVHHRDDRTLSQLSKISAIIRHDLGAKAKCQRVWGPASLIWKGWTSLEGAAAGGRRGLAHNFLEKCDLRGNTNRMQIQIQRQIHSMQNVDFSGGGWGGWASGWFGFPNLGWWLHSLAENGWFNPPLFSWRNPNMKYEKYSWVYGLAKYRHRTSLSVLSITTIIPNHIRRLQDE